MRIFNVSPLFCVFMRIYSIIKAISVTGIKNQLTKRIVRTIILSVKCIWHMMYERMLNYDKNIYLCRSVDR